MAKLGKFQSMSFTHWQGLTTDNHLGSLFQTQPQKASDLMVQLLAVNRGKTLESYLSKFPVKYFDSEEEYTWEVIGSSRRNIPIIEARDGITGQPLASGNYGVAKEPFYVVFPEDWFARTKVA